jgi:hypothetical protein
MNLMTPPEIADGGYWYVVPIVADSELGEQTPGVIPGVGWCAWYGSTQVAIRTPDPVAGFTAGGNVAAILIEAGSSEKPLGRVGGQ